MRIAHVSDTHFGTERAEMLAGLLAALEELRPGVVVLSGDVTQRARRSEFDAARRFVEALPSGAHRIVIPGNHDIPLFDLWHRFIAPYAGYERALGPRESLWQAGGIALLAVDATHPRRHSLGELPPGRLRDGLRAARAACGAKGLLLVVAHQPLWTAWGEDKRQTLIGRHETARLLSEAHADIVFSGHVHVPFIGTSATSDPHLDWRFVLCGAGTAISHRTRLGVPNSFNVVELDASRPAIRVLRHDWGGAKFAAGEILTFRRGAAGWAACQE
jgi:3',5'-cyclic AMP phosphodiesterase CpdA